MPESFDPYRKWLGIPPAEQPANHYRLLGIAVFEDDPDVVAYAADRQMSHVRKFQSGENGALAQKLLSELANARRCLLADAERRPYDAQLKKQLGVASNGNIPVAPQPTRTPPVPAPTPAPPAVKTVAPPQPEPPVATAEVPKAQPIATTTNSDPAVAVRSRPVSSAARRGRRKNSAVPMIAALCALAGMACVGLIVVVVIMSELEEDPSASGNIHNVPTTPVEQPNSQPPKSPQQNNPRPEPPKDKPKPPVERDPVMPEEGIGSSSDGADDGNASAVAVDNPQRRLEFEQAASAAEQALAVRDMTTASEQLTKADALKFSVEEAKQISNLQIAYDRLTQFWTAIDSGLKRLKPGDEVGIGDEIANFVSTQDESVTLLITGNRKTEPLSELESPYLVAIARRGLSSSDPVTKLVLSTFLAVDQRDASTKQLDQARSLYADAIAAGETCDFLAERLKIEDDTQALPKPGGSGGAEVDAPESSLDVPDLPVDFADPDGTLPKPGDEAEVGPAVDVSQFFNAPRRRQA